MNIYNNLEMNKNQIKKGVYERLASPPTNPVEGQFYYNTTDKQLYYYDGTKWVTSASSIQGMSTQATSLTCTLPDNL